MSKNHLLLFLIPMFSSCMNIGTVDRDLQAILAGSKPRHIRASLSPSYEFAQKRKIIAPPLILPVRGIGTKIELSDSPEIRKQLKRYLGNGRKDVLTSWQRRAKHEQTINKVLSYYGLPLELSNLAFVESKFKTTAQSHRGARGMWQLMKYTAQDLGLSCGYFRDDRTDVLRATIAASRYLTELHEKFGDWMLALAAYNAGPGRVSKAIKKAGGNNVSFFDLAKKGLLPSETVGHVSKFVAITMITRNPDVYGFYDLLTPIGDQPLI